MRKVVNAFFALILLAGTIAGTEDCAMACAVGPASTSCYDGANPRAECSLTAQCCCPTLQHVSFEEFESPAETRYGRPDPAAAHSLSQLIARRVDDSSASWSSTPTSGTTAVSRYRLKNAYLI